MWPHHSISFFFFFFQAEDGIRDYKVTGVQTCALPISACQNLMLAARALGIGSVPTTLHAKVMDRLYALLGIPKDGSFPFSIPPGYPPGGFGGGRRFPPPGTTFLNPRGTGAPGGGEGAGSAREGAPR